MENSQKAGFFRPVDNSLSLSLSLSLCLTLLLGLSLVGVKFAHANPASGLDNLVASTYLGASGAERGSNLAQDSLGNLFVLGYTTLTNDFPTTTGAYQGANAGGTYDAVIAKLNSGLTSLLGSTYLGPTLEDRSRVIITDTIGNIYVLGQTASAAFPTTTGVYQKTFGTGAYDIFISKFGNPVPTLTSLSPTEVYNDHGAFTLTITGTGFNVSTTVTYAGSSKTVTYVSSTQITINILSTDLGTDGLAYKGVKTTNVQPGGGDSNTVNLSVRLRVGSSASVAPATSADTPAPVSVPTPAPVVTTSTPPNTTPEPLLHKEGNTPDITPPVIASVAVAYVFKKNLRSGMNNSDVKKLQVFLNTHGFKVAAKGAGSPGKETTYFGAATRAAIMKFQKANKIKPVNGLLGPLTRGKINAM